MEKTKIFVIVAITCSVIILCFLTSCGKDSYVINDYETGTFVDERDGRVYKTVSIGKQVWMAENLAYLPKVTFYDDWGSKTEPQYTVLHYWPGSGTETVESAMETENYQKYRVLYNWAAAMNGANSSNSNPSKVQGICPTGWHLPSQSEWNQLIDYVGGEPMASAKLKESGTAHWQPPNLGATNETGFTALPGGRRPFASGTFIDYCNGGFWWSSTALIGNTHAYSYWMCANTNYDNKGEQKVEFGLSVRCVKDR